MSDVQIAVIDQQNTEVTVAVPGVQGPAGEGVPQGGTANQVLFKQSGTDYDTAWGEVTSAMIGDLEIVDADVAAGAAIAGTKISPNFGSQNVTTTGTSTAVSFIPTGSTVPTNGVYLPAANTVALSTNGTGRLFVDASGNVGVGASPTSLFSVRGNTPAINIDDELNTSSKLVFRPAVLGYAERAGFSLNYLTGEFRQFSGASGAGYFQTIYTEGTERLRITSAGLVGIGTSSPGHNLEIQATAGASQNAVIRLRATDSGSGAGSVADISAIGTGAQVSALAFSTRDGSNIVERLRIDGAGGVYIGNSSDYSTVNYSQTTGNGNYYYSPDDGSSGGTIIASNNADRGWSIAYLNKFAWNSGDDARWITFYLNGSDQDSITWTGSAINYGTSSDYRRKANATTYTGGLEKVKQLHVREYDWIEFPDADRSVGFFAHELQEIFPQAVTGIKDGMKIDEFSGEEVPDYQGVDYGKITPLLTSALQEAIAKIETLEAKVAALESA